MPIDLEKNFRGLYSRVQLVMKHLRRFGVVYLIFIGGIHLILFTNIPTGEERYINAVVEQYAGRTSMAGGSEYLVMKTQGGKSVSVGIKGRPKIGDEFVLKVQGRYFPFGPVYSIHKPL